MNTPKSCPGYEQFKNLTSFECSCPQCGKGVEVFSDEFEKEHICKGCNKPIDFSKCTVTASATQH